MTWIYGLEATFVQKWVFIVYIRYRFQSFEVFKLFACHQAETMKNKNDLSMYDHMPDDYHPNYPELDDDHEKEKVDVCDVIFGIILMLISGVMYSGLAALVKWGSNLGFSAAEILIYRATIQILLCLFSSVFSYTLQPFSCKCNVNDMKQSVSSLAGNKKLIFAILGRGLFGAFSTLTYFEGAVLLPIGDCVTLKALVTVVTSFVAWVLFGESITKKHFIALFLCLVGVVCITQPPMIFTGIISTDKASTHTHNEYYGYMIASSSALCQSVVYICIKYAKKSAVFILILSQGIFSVIVGFVFQTLIFQNSFHLFADGVSDNLVMECLCLFFIGTIGFAAQWTLTKGGQLIMSGVASMLRCTDIFWCFLWQIFIFDTKPNIVDWGGAFAMFASVILITLEKISKAKKAQKHHKLSISQHILLLENNVSDTSDSSDVQNTSDGFVDGFPLFNSQTSVVGANIGPDNANNYASK